MQSGTFTFIYTWVDQYVAGNSKAWPSFLSLEIGIAPSYTLNSNGQYSIMVSRKGWPYDAAIVSAIGGIIILYVGIFGLLVLFHTAHTSFDMLLEITGTVSGMLILVSSSLLYFNRKRHVIWGIIIFVCSILSWAGTSGGLFFGFVLVFLGGIMAISWSPEPMVIRRQGQEKAN
jgi:hypothetical protein